MNEKVERVDPNGKDRKVLPRDIMDLIKVRNRWARRLKRLYRNTLSRDGLEYKNLSLQIKCLKIIIPVRACWNESFRRKVSVIKPGPEAFNRIYGLIGRGKGTGLEQLEVYGQMLKNRNQITVKLKEHFESLYSENNGGVIEEIKAHIENEVETTL